MPPIKRKKFLHPLKRIENHGDIRVKFGGKHLKVESIDSGGSYPIPVAHKEIDERILRKFKEWLKAHNVRGIEELNGVV